MPEGLTTIAQGAFANDNGLKYIYLPQSLGNIGQSTFFGCSNLTDVYYGGGELSWKAVTIYDAEDTISGRYIHGATKHYFATADALNTVI